MFLDGLETVPNLMPIFITVDPERDTPKVIKEYLNGKHCYYTSIKEERDVAPW